MNTSARALFASALVLSVLATFALTARLYCRRLKDAALQSDDWLAIAAWVLTFAYSVTVEWGVFHADVGLPESQLSPDRAVGYFKIAFLVELLLAPASGFIKISVLAFYRRVFIKRSFVIVVNLIIVLVSAWTIASFFVFLLNLIPVDLEWSTSSARPDRTKFPVFVVCYCVFGLIFDLVIVFLPLPMLRRLQASKQRKFKYYSFFLFWTFCCITAVIKIAYAVKWFQWNNLVGFAQVGDVISVATTNLQMWYLIECNVAVTASCLPILGPLYKKSKALADMMRRKSDASSSDSEMKQSAEKSRPGSGESDRSVQNASAESQKWRAIWRTIAGTNTITSVEHGSNRSQSGYGPDRMAILVEERFGTEVHDVHGAVLSSSSPATTSEGSLNQKV